MTKTSFGKRRPLNASALAGVVAAAVVATSTQTYAGSVSNATITGLTYFEGTNGKGQDGNVLIWTNLVNSGKPSCAQGTWQNTFTVNPGTTGGAAILAGVISAQAQGLPVTIQGAGTCTLTGSSEDLSWFGISP